MIHHIKHAFLSLALLIGVIGMFCIVADHSTAHDECKIVLEDTVDVELEQEYQLDFEDIDKEHLSPSTYFTFGKSLIRSFYRTPTTYVGSHLDKGTPPPRLS